MEEETILNTDDSVMEKTFFWMFLGLLGTAITAWYANATGLVMDMALSGGFEMLMIIELIVVLLFSFLFKKLPASIVGILYFAYSFLNGFSFSVIFVVFELSSIVYVFLGTAGLFGLLAFYGYKTEKSIDNWQPILTSGLLIGIVVSLINLFVGNTVIDIIIDWVMIFIFCAFTIYDMHKLRQLQEMDIEQDKAHIYCAMQLYLDFINLFLRILSIFGKRRK